MPSKNQYLLGGIVTGAAKTLPSVLSHLRAKKEKDERDAERASNKRIEFLMMAATKEEGITASKFMEYARRIGATQEEIDMAQEFIREPKTNPLQHFNTFMRTDEYRTPQGQIEKLSPEMKKEKGMKWLAKADIPAHQRALLKEAYFGEEEPDVDIYEEKALKREWRESGEDERRGYEKKYPNIDFKERPKKPSTKKSPDRTVSEYSRQVSEIDKKINQLKKETNIDPEDVGIPELQPPNYEQNLRKLDYLKVIREHLTANINNPYSKPEWQKILKEYKLLEKQAEKEDLSKASDEELFRKIKTGK